MGSLTAGENSNGEGTAQSKLEKKQAREILALKAKLAAGGTPGKQKPKKPVGKVEKGAKYNPNKPYNYIHKEEWVKLSAEQKAAARKARAEKGIPTKGSTPRGLKAMTRKSTTPKQEETQEEEVEAQKEEVKEEPPAPEPPAPDPDIFVEPQGRNLQSAMRKVMTPARYFQAPSVATTQRAAYYQGKRKRAPEDAEEE